MRRSSGTEGVSLKGLVGPPVSSSPPSVPGQEVSGFSLPHISCHDALPLHRPPTTEANGSWTETFIV